MATLRNPALAHQVAADPDLARTDRIAIGLAMSADNFSVDDVARVVSLRRQVIIGLREQTFLPPRPYNKTAVISNRPLEPVVAALQGAAIGELADRCRALGIHLVTGLGILRALEYSQRMARDGAPRLYRCPGCEQVTTTHPCQLCGTRWLPEAPG